MQQTQTKKPLDFSTEQIEQRELTTSSLQQNIISDEDRHRYKAQVAFIMDVQVNLQELDKKIWTPGPNPHPLVSAKDKYNKEYGAKVRSSNFPSTLAPMLYGDPKNYGDTEQDFPRYYSKDINFDATCWVDEILGHKNDQYNRSIDQ